MPNVSYEGVSHYVRDTHVEYVGSKSIASAVVSGKRVQIEYTGSVSSEFGDTDSKPWLKQVRQDLVKKYVEIYGNIVDPRYAKKRKKNRDYSSFYSSLVDDSFMKKLERLGYPINGNEITVCGHRIDLEGMSQVKALLLIKENRENAIKAESIVINILFEDIA